MLVLDDWYLLISQQRGYFHQGQVCMATSRHIVLRKVAAAYAEKLAAHAAALPVGDPFRQQVAIGPMINEKQVNRVHGIVNDSVKAGAKLVTGGTHDGLFYKPTVLSEVGTETRAFQEEIFGPVAPITIAEDDDHAIALANSTGYGLAAAVQTGSTDRGYSIARKLKAGMVHVNDQTIADHAGIPMGGIGQSGNGSALWRHHQPRRIHGMAVANLERQTGALSILRRRLIRDGAQHRSRMIEILK